MLENQVNAVRGFIWTVSIGNIHDCFAVIHLNCFNHYCEIRLLLLFRSVIRWSWVLISIFSDNACISIDWLFCPNAVILLSRSHPNESDGIELIAMEYIWTKLSSSILDAYLVQSMSISHLSLSHSHRSPLWNDFHQFFSINHRLEPIQNQR